MQVDWWPSWGRQQPTPTPADLVKGASCLISTCVGFFEDRSSNLTGHSLDCVLQSARPWPCPWDPEIYTFQKLRASTQNGIGFKPMIKIKSQRKRTEEGPQARHIGGEFHTPTLTNMKIAPLPQTAFVTSALSSSWSCWETITSWMCKHATHTISSKLW